MEKDQNRDARGRKTVLTDAAIMFASLIFFAVTKAVFANPRWLAESVPRAFMLLIFCWALYAGYRWVRWVAVVVNIGLALALASAFLTQGTSSLWWSIPLTLGHGFVGLSLVLSASVRGFLERKRLQRTRTQEPFSRGYTATLAFFGGLFFSSLGAAWPVGLLDWQPGSRFLTALFVAILGGLGAAFLLVAGLRLGRLPWARRLTTAASILLACLPPFGTAPFVVWLTTVRRAEQQERTG